MWTGIEIVAAGVVALIFAILSMVRLVKVRESGMPLWSAVLRTGIALLPTLLFILGASSCWSASRVWER